MAWWVTALWWVGSLILGELLRPKPKFDKPQASSLGDFDLPTASEERKIPVVFGTCEVQGPNVFWYGDLSTTAIKRKVKTGWFSSEDQTIAWKYYLGIQYGLCWGPVDKIRTVHWDKRQHNPMGVFPVDGPDPVTVTFDAEGMFGGVEKEGGIWGHMRFYFGTDDQPADTYLEGVIGESLPAYRGLCYAVAQHMYLGTSPYLKPVSFMVVRCPNGLNLPDGKHNIDGDANPACILYDALTNADWGLGISSGMIDLDVFRAVGDVLHGEGLHLSLMMDGGQNARDFVEDVCRHIDGIVFTDTATGLITIKLARFDYDPETLPVLDESSIENFEIDRPNWDQTRNVVRVKYLERGANTSQGPFIEERVAQAQDLANIQARGGILATEEIQFLGAAKPALAQRLAARSLKTLSFPFPSVRFDADRSAWALRPGAVVKINYAPLGISGLVVRVTRIGSGTITDGKIRIEGVEDVFAVSWTAYTAPPASGWEDPMQLPGPPLDSALHACPYEAVRPIYEPARLPRGMTFLARMPGELLTGYTIYRYRTEELSWTPTSCLYLTPLGYLESILAETGTTFVVTNGVDVETVPSVSYEEMLGGVSLLVLASEEVGDHGHWSEIVAFQIITALGSDRFRVSAGVRGCIDTVPRSFPAGTKVWFMSAGHGLRAAERPQDTSGPGSGLTIIEVKLAPFNDLGEYEDWMTEPTHQLLVRSKGGNRYTQREDVPFCPTHFKLNAVAYPASISGELTVSWKHRNRNGTWNYGDSGVSDVPEPDTFYVVQVYGELGTLVHEEFPLTDESWTYLQADEIAESGLGRLNNQLRVVLFTWRGTEANYANPGKFGEWSWQEHDWTVARV
jgi:hypothetical protein